MSYNVTINKKTFDLPRPTISIEEMVEDMRDKEKEVSNGTAKKRELVQMMVNFVEHCIGAEQAQSVLDYTSIEDVDTKEIEIACDRILNAYTKKGLEEKTAELKKLTSDINSAVNMSNLKHIASLTGRK